MTTNLVQNSSEKFVCDMCDYSTSRKSQYDRHLSTSKHLHNSQILQNTTDLVPKVSDFVCSNCNKIYKHHSSLYNHKKNCKINETENNENENNEIIKNTDKKDDLINYLIKENQEFKNLILEIVKKDTNNITNNTTNTNSHNKSFNLQLFLNETCKDAMNIMDFVESIQLQLSDLEKVGEIGFVEGISNIIVKNLKALDVTQRPVHCTDKKREVLYVKDEDKWEKQDEENVKLRKVIKKVTDKNMRLIPKYREKYPDCNQSISRHSDQYNKIIVESMGGSGDNDHEKASKIIKNISKQVLVEKEPEAPSL
jgi:hypothetical protein